MMDQTAKRMWDAGLATLSPSHLIDRFLDWVEQLGEAMMLSPQADNLSCQEIRNERRFD